jgi:hypothetical protein
MANNDVYQVTDKSVFQGQECLNVYFFQERNLLGAPDASDMADAYIGQLLPLVLAAQLIDVVHTEVSVRNLFDPSDVHVVAMSEPGDLIAGWQALPIFNAVGFRLVGDNGAVRNGSKRYCGLAEEEQTDGTIDLVGFIAALDDLATKLFDTLLFGVIEQFVPVVVKRLLVGGEYVLPANLGEAVVSSVIDAVWNPAITSQVSRKVGVGA